MELHGSLTIWGMAAAVSKASAVPCLEARWPGEGGPAGGVRSLLRTPPEQALLQRLSVETGRLSKLGLSGPIELASLAK